MMGQRDQDMDFNYLQRVKVYKLNDDGKWDDKGTGHVSVEYLQKSDAMGLVVLDESDSTSLMIHRISGDDIYQRQEETIISWTDPEIATDLALSFQETVGCSYIWDQICAVQKQIQFPSGGALDANTRHFAEELEHSGTSQDDEDTLQEGGRTDTSDLPPVAMNSLPQIAKVLVDVPPFHRDRLASALLKESGEYIKKLVDLFKLLEDLENVEGLQHMFKIMKGIVLLGHVHVYDILFSDNYLTDVIGALEYDPDLPVAQEHRKYLKEQAVFKEVVPIEDPNVRFRIKQTYYLGYLKDAILPRVLDDTAFSALANVILCNNVEIVQHLQLNRPFILELFARLQAINPLDIVWKEMVLFLREFCSLSKQLQPVHRNDLYSTLIGNGLFDVVTTALESSDDVVRGSGTDILMSTLNHDPSVLRQFLVEQKNHTLFTSLVKGMLSPSDGGIQVQLLEMMRMLLDSDTMEAPSEKSTFLDVFYEEYIDKLVAALACGCPSRGEQVKSPFGLATQSAPDVLNNISDILCFCVHHHSFRIKYYVLRNNLVEKVLRLTRRKEKYLVVAAVRFLRTCIGLKDEFYYRYLIKNNLFEPVFQAFWANGNKYNLLNSAVIEMVEFIWKENIKSLMTHIVQTYWLRFDAIDYVQTFRKLKLKYEQSMEGPPAAPQSTSADIRPGFAAGTAAPLNGTPRGLQGLVAAENRRRDERALDKDEEDYFNADSDDEEDTASAPPLAPLPSRQKTPPPPAVIMNGIAIGPHLPLTSSGGFGLVDYEDEEEESPPSFSGAGTGTGTGGPPNGNPQPGSNQHNFDMGPLALSPISDPMWLEVGSPPRIAVGKRLADAREQRLDDGVLGDNNRKSASGRMMGMESVGGEQQIQVVDANHLSKKRRLGFEVEERGAEHAKGASSAEIAERVEDGNKGGLESERAQLVMCAENGVWPRGVERVDADHGRRCKESSSSNCNEEMQRSTTSTSAGAGAGGCDSSDRGREADGNDVDVVMSVIDVGHGRDGICGRAAACVSNTKQGECLRADPKDESTAGMEDMKQTGQGTSEDHVGGDYRGSDSTINSSSLALHGGSNNTSEGASLGADLQVRGSDIVRAATSSQEPYEVR